MNTEDNKTLKNQKKTSLGEVTGLHRRYDWKPYTYHRIMRILANNGLRAEKLWQGYKGSRKPGYREVYRIVQISDGKIIKDVIDLDGMRRAFAALDIPLKDEITSDSGEKSH